MHPKIRCWKIFHTIVGIGWFGIATSGSNGSSPRWKPSSYGGGGLFIIPNKIQELWMKIILHCIKCAKWNVAN